MGICQHARARLNKRKTKVLFVDVDDTLIYWFPHYIQWLFKKNFEQGTDLDTHDIVTMVHPKTYMEFNQSNFFVNKREVIVPIYTFVKSCESRGVEIIFVSACGREVAANQHLALSNVFSHIEDFEYKTFVFDTSNEKIEFINNIVTKQNIHAMLLDDKRETCEAVECIATDSKNLEELTNLAHIALNI
jgi:predicted secreted acid phosphatase